MAVASGFALMLCPFSIRVRLLLAAVVLLLALRAGQSRLRSGARFRRAGSPDSRCSSRSGLFRVVVVRPLRDNRRDRRSYAWAAAKRVCHSSPVAPQGLAGARLPYFSDQSRYENGNRYPTARMDAPAVDRMFSIWNSGA